MHWLYTYRNEHNSVETSSVNQQPAVLQDKSAYSTVSNYRQHVVLVTGNLAYGISNVDNQQIMLQDNPAYSIVKRSVASLNWSRQEWTKSFAVFPNL